MNTSLLCCDQCGCTDVEYLEYIHANSGEVMGGNESSMDGWCPKCAKKNGNGDCRITNTQSFEEQKEKKSE